MNSVTVNNKFKESIKRVHFDKLKEDRYYYVNILSHTAFIYEVNSLWIKAKINSKDKGSVTVDNISRLYTPDELFFGTVLKPAPRTFTATKDEVDGNENTPMEFHLKTLELRAGELSRYRFYVLKKTASSKEGKGSSASPVNGPGTFMSARGTRASRRAALALPGKPAVAQAMGGGGSSRGLPPRKKLKSRRSTKRVRRRA